MRLIKQTSEFCVDTEQAAKEAMEQCRRQAADAGNQVIKAGYVYKTKKSKGEIIGEQYVVTVVIQYGEIWEDFE